MESVGERVRRYRRLRGLTQDQLAEAATVDRRYLGRIETADVEQPGVDVMVKIARALGVPVRALADPRLYEEEASSEWESALMAKLLREGASEEEAAATVQAVRTLVARRVA